MPYEFYKILHFLGLFLTLSGLIGLLSIIWNGSTPTSSLRKVWMISHGVGLLILIVTGFGLAARLGYVTGLPVWIYYKMVIWLLAGVAVSLIKRMPKYSKYWFIVTLLLLTTAAFVAVTKPGL